MSYDETFEQAASAGDAQTQDQGIGPGMVDLVPKATLELQNEASATDFDDTPSEGEMPEEMEPAAKRRSDKEWQETREKARDGDKATEALAVLAERLGIKPEEARELSVEELAARIDSQNARNSLEVERLEWEMEHPIVRSEKYKDAWRKLNKEASNPDHKYHKLSFEERFNQLRATLGETTVNTYKELRDQQARYESSVPSQTRSVEDHASVDQEALSIGAAMGYGLDDFRKAGQA